MKTYSVHAKHWDGGWELHIDDLGVTQSESLSDAELTARDYIALDLEVPADSFKVEIIPEGARESLTPEERRLADIFIEALRRNAAHPEQRKEA